MANGDISKLGLRGASVNARFWCSPRTQFSGAFLQRDNEEDGPALLYLMTGNDWQTTIRAVYLVQRAAGEGARATQDLETHSRSDNFLTALAISGSLA